MVARSRVPGALAVLLASGCAHHALSPDALERLQHPAFISRIEEGAGPRSTVFRDDEASYRDRLKTLDAKEADRRLTAKLSGGVKDQAGKANIPTITRFEIADTLRAEVQGRLPREAPWTALQSPVEVATVLESFLVEEVPANAPDYPRLGQLGTDSVLEIVVEEFGLRSERGKAGLRLLGLARLFTLDGHELYHRRFVSDELAAGLEGLDPFAVAKNPALFRDRMKTMLAAIAVVIAGDLSPGERRREPSPSAGDAVTPRKIERKAPAPQEDPL